MHCPAGNATNPIWRVLSFFPSLKQNFIAYRSSKVSSRPDCIFEIHQLWHSAFSWVYSNSCCSCSFEPEIIKIPQSSHKIDRNNLLSFQEPTTILNVCTKKVWKIIECMPWLAILGNIFWCFYSYSSLIHFENCSEQFTMRSTRLLIPLLPCLVPWKFHISWFICSPPSLFHFSTFYDQHDKNSISISRLHSLITCLRVSIFLIYIFLQIYSCLPYT